MLSVTYRTWHNGNTPSLSFSHSTPSSILYECWWCQTKILSFERGSKSRLSPHSPLMNGSDFKFIIINNECVVSDPRRSAYVVVQCSYMLHLVKSIQTWGWITLPLFPLIRQLWLSASKKTSGVMYEKRTRLRKRRAENWSRASRFCHHLPAFISFQSHIIFFFLWKTKVGLKW